MSNKLVLTARTEVTDPEIDYEDIGNTFRTIYIYDDARRILRTNDLVLVHITGRSDILTTVARGAGTSRAILITDNSTLAASIFANRDNKRVLLVITFPEVKTKQLEITEPMPQFTLFDYSIDPTITTFTFQDIPSENTDSIPMPKGKIINTYSNFIAQNDTAVTIYQYLKTMVTCQDKLTIRNTVDCNKLLHNMLRNK